MTSSPLTNWAMRRIERTLDRRLANALRGFALQLPGQPRRVFGAGDPVATIVARDGAAVRAIVSLDLTRIAEAYRSGALDVDGDLCGLMSLRDVFPDRHPLTWLWHLLQPRLFGQQDRDAAWIEEHYDQEPDFFLTFLDRRHRCYSQAVFADAREDLETAQTRKLDFAIASTRLRPGDRVLDIGGGWGAFTEYAGQRGIQVTSLTISKVSERFIQALIDAQRLPCRVLREHLFVHQPAERYDAIVNLGVTEHLPDYPGTIARYLKLLKPGGRVYLDASASRLRYDLSAFLLRYLFPGNGTLLCLHEYLTAVSQTPFEVVAVHNDRENYGLTTRRWAENLDRHAPVICERWGEPLYRTFRLYLWGCVDGFTRDMIQAYRVVLERPVSA
jgi:cyclopropane-fatty-acyl-phospholipid synthase